MRQKKIVCINLLKSARFLCFYLNNLHIFSWYMNRVCWNKTGFSGFIKIIFAESIGGWKSETRVRNGTHPARRVCSSLIAESHRNTSRNLKLNSCKMFRQQQKKHFISNFMSSFKNSQIFFLSFFKIKNISVFLNNSAGLCLFFVFILGKNELLFLILSLLFPRSLTCCVLIKNLLRCRQLTKINWLGLCSFGTFKLSL